MVQIDVRLTCFASWPTSLLISVNSVHVVLFKKPVLAVRFISDQADCQNSATCHWVNVINPWYFDVDGVFVLVFLTTWSYLKMQICSSHWGTLPDESVVFSRRYVYISQIVPQQRFRPDRACSRQCSAFDPRVMIYLSSTSGCFIIILHVDCQSDI